MGLLLLECVKVISAILLSGRVVSYSGRHCQALSLASSGLPDVFVAPQFVEPGEDAIDGSVARVAIGERSTSELLSTQLTKGSFNGIG